jgi:hypothetical protein
MQMQVRRKSGVLGFILEFLIPGLGFLYAGAGFARAALMFVIAVVLYGAQGAFGQINPSIALIVGLGSLVFFIYREVTLLRFTGRLNRGQL